MTGAIPSIEPGVPGRDGRVGLLLRVPYRESFVTALKLNLRAQLRYWDVGVGAWWVDRSEAAVLAKIVLEHFPMVFVLGGPGEEGQMLHRRGEAAPVPALQRNTREVS